MSRPVCAACALLALMVLVTGCGGDTKSAAYPVPPLAAPGEDAPAAEVSENLALALGSESTSPETFEEKRDKLPSALVGDRGNAVYSGQRLTGSVTAPAAASTRASSVPPVVPPAPSAPPAPVLAKAPPAVPRVPVEQQAAAALPATPPVAAKPSPPAPPAPTADSPDAGRVTVQLAAFRTRANAEGGWQRLRSAHPDQLGDRALIVRETDLGDRGIYYRVRTGPFADVAAAKAFCALLRARDQACVVKRPQ